jgi:hypothetical protein
MPLPRPARRRLWLAAAWLVCCAPCARAVPTTVTVESKDYLRVGFSGTVSLAQLVLTGNYSSSPTDPHYAAARRPVRAGRRSQLLQFPRYPNYSLNATNGHWAYLQLPRALVGGKLAAGAGKRATAHAAVRRGAVPQNVARITARVDSSTDTGAHAPLPCCLPDAQHGLLSFEKTK